MEGSPRLSDGLARRGDHLPGQRPRAARDRDRREARPAGARAGRASSTGPPNSEPRRVMLPPSGFGTSQTSVASGQVGDEHRAHVALRRRCRASPASARTQKSASGHQAENQNGNSPALGEQQAEQRERDQRRGRRSSSRAARCDRVERADRAHQREERGRHRARQRRADAPGDGERPRARRLQRAQRAERRRRRRARTRASRSRAAPRRRARRTTAPPSAPASPQRVAHEAVEQPRARDRRSGAPPRPGTAARPAAGTARCR